MLAKSDVYLCIFYLILFIKNIKGKILHIFKLNFLCYGCSKNNR